MLETRNITIRFGGHVAVDHVSCAFAPGTLTAIVGPNGAGKTTYFNLISGQLRATEGSVHFDGVDITNDTASSRTHRGLGRAFQLTQLFPNLSVVENVRLAVQARRKQGLNLWSVWLDHRDTLARAHELVDRVKLGDRTDAAASSLPHGDQRSHPIRPPTPVLLRTRTDAVIRRLRSPRLAVLLAPVHGALLRSAFS